MAHAILHGFSNAMSHDVPAFKFSVHTSDYKFCISVNKN